VERTLRYTELLPFQGALKHSSDSEIAKLAESLRNDGLVTPFIIWHKPCAINVDANEWFASQPHYVIDGHRRLLAIQRIAQTEPEVLNQEYPVLLVEAADIETAKKQLLLICSSYGKITGKGMQTFLSDAPSIRLDETSLKVKTVQLKLPKEPSTKAQGKTVLKIRVNTADITKICEILLSAGVEVL
jgi:hypothetical protein